MAGLVTLDDVKTWLGITTATYDTILGWINDGMCVAVENYVGHDFTEKTVLAEVLDATRSDSILPNNVPVTEVTNLYFHTLSDGSGGSLIDPSEYRLQPDGNAIILQNFFTPNRRSRIALDYKWGYPAGLPADVHLMLLQAVEAEFRRKGDKSLGRGGRSKKDESETFAGKDGGYWDARTGLPHELVAKLTQYKTFEFPTQPMATRNL